MSGNEQNNGFGGYGSYGGGSNPEETSVDNNQAWSSDSRWNQEPQNPFRQSPPQPQPMPQKQKRDNTSLLIVIAAILGVIVLALGGYLGYTMMSGSGSNDSGQFAEGANNANKGANSDNNDGAAEETTEEAPARAQNWTQPAGWTKCGGSGDPGDLNLYFAGTSTTTCGFVSNVRDAVVDKYLDSGELEGTVNAYSPTTGLNYTMTCTDDGDVVTCTGGRNAVVHIV